MPITGSYTDLDTGRQWESEIFLPWEVMHTKVWAPMKDITPSEEVKRWLDEILRKNKVN